MVEVIVLARRLLVTVAFCGVLAACGARDPGTRAGVAFTPDIQGIGNLIAASAQYPSTALEMTSSSVRLRIAVSDPKLAAADEPTRRAAAAALVAIAETVLASHPEYANLEAVSIAIIHPSVAGSDWHTEDVVEFRKGPNQRFSEHTT